MSRKEAGEATRRYEESLDNPGGEPYSLRLYVTGATPGSTRAIANLKRICEEHLKGRYELQVIDLFQQPALARGDQIVAAPTLVKLLPPPLRRLIGDLSDDEGVLVGLDVRRRPPDVQE